MSGWEFYGSDGKLKGLGAQGPTGAAVVPVATTVSGLGGTPANGVVGMIRAGATPYEFTQLIYDSTYGKWVSQAQAILVCESVADMLVNVSTGGVYTDVVVTSFPRYPTVPNFKALYDAGLRPQVCVSAWMNASAANNMFLRAAFSTANDGDSSGSFSRDLTGGEISVTGATDTYKTSGWADMTGAPTRAHGLFMLQYKTSTNVSDARGATVGLRWVG